MGLRGPGSVSPTLFDSSNGNGAGPTFDTFAGVPGPGEALLWERVVAWCECLPVPSGLLADTNFVLEEWQREIVRGLFPEDRVVRQAVVSMPRKNGKTGLASALALACLCGPLCEKNGEIYSAAADRAQAAITHRVMSSIIEMVPLLAASLTIRSWDKTIEDTQSGSTFKSISADAKTKHGLSASFIIADELAQWPGRELWDVLTTSTGARAHPLVLAISTQSPRSEHVLSELIDYGELGGDPTFFSRVWAAPDDADPWAEDTWRDCNPGLGSIRSLEELQSSALQAQRMPARESAFRNLYLNQRIAADAGFLPIQEWMACAGEPSFSGPCHVGIDLASVRDLAAVAAYWPQTGAVQAWGWVPGKTLAEEGSRVPYDVWEQEGRIFGSITEDTIDRRAIVQFLAQFVAANDVMSVSYDRWGISEFERLVDEEGVYLPEASPFGQGYKDMSPAVRELERLILDRTLVHDSNPLLAWTFSNLVVAEDPAGNRKFVKSDASDKIDQMIALTMCIGAAEKATSPSYQLEVIEI